MHKQHKNLLRSLVTNLRDTLAGHAKQDGPWQRGDLDRELERLGMATDGTVTPFDVVPNPTPHDRRARAAADAFITAAVNGAKGSHAEQQRRAARADVVERAAYTWINRLLALRAMEARGLIDETLRNNPDYDGISEALFILRSDAPSRCAGADGGWWAVLEDACQSQVAALPGLFDLNDPAAALRPTTPALLHCISLVGVAPTGYTLDDADAAFADPDAIGWAYQFYQEAAKARVYAKLGTGGKAASRAEIAAATQLFTEPYMVQWILQNSLGRSYHEAYPDSRLPESWEYYIRHRPEGQTAPEHPRSLDVLDLIDPCCGSGHFLREAFDMFVAMYRERHPDMRATQIANRILERHLHGIDLDPRAAQLAALTLYLRAWELMRDERRTQRQPGAGRYQPAAMNIATTPSGLSAGALQRHLKRHPGDRVMKPLLEGIFTALEQADILGSLLRPSEHIDTAIQALQQPHTVEMDFNADDAALRRTITMLARSDPAELKRTLLDRVAQSFRSEAGDSADVAAALFGREAAGGVRLLQLLDRTYAVVVTNPPYMGSGNMDVPLKKYVEQHYKPGKRDLYAAFILRCLELCRKSGRVAMVTQQSWFFLSSFADLRIHSLKSKQITKGKNITVLEDTELEALVHLGRYAFSEIGNAAVAPLLFVIKEEQPSANHHIWACRLSAPRLSTEQAYLLRKVTRVTSSSLNEVLYIPRQLAFRRIPLAPIVYWLPGRVLEILGGDQCLAKTSDPIRGLDTCDMPRFIRYQWETMRIEGWQIYVNGGGYKKWKGLRLQSVNWKYDGAAIKSFPGSIVPNEHKYNELGITFTDMCSGSFNCRKKGQEDIFGVSGSAIFRIHSPILEVMGILNTRVTSYIMRAISPTPKFRTGYVKLLPYPSQIFDFRVTLLQTVQMCLMFKSLLVREEIIEFDFSKFEGKMYQGFDYAAILHTIEGVNESLAFNAYSLTQIEIDAIIAETGTPAGFHPLITCYDTLPNLPADLNLPPLPQEVFDYLASHERITPDTDDLARIKANLRILYEAGPGAKDVELDEGETTNGDEDDESAMSGAHIPIPTETFLEELAVQLEIHPISVYWLLEELRGEGVRCKLEERRLLDDRLSVIVLLLLGHRWPKQIEAGEPVPDWADEDGVIPFITGTGQPTLVERIRGRLRAEDGDLGALRTEALLVELTGMSLDDWLRREFFKRHVRQFKYRPIAWHLASTPSVASGTGKRGKRGGARSTPAFECLLFYHACDSDVLARIRTQYVDPLLRVERQRLAAARQNNEETDAALAQSRISELEDFNRRLLDVAERGFDCPELVQMLAEEPLDRWSGDGYMAPATHADLLRQEQAWRVDLNDGVRVNIAPLQRAGLLTSDVLKAADAKKAIADRARWRSDERRWVRQGTLPRCGWMPNDVPESPAWTALAPQREAEQVKLEAKRRAVMEQIDKSSNI